MQGRFAVIGRRSIQMWIVDADPAQFTLQQTLENIGTVNGFSIQQIGDYDVLFVDDTGVRSLHASEITLNSSIDDIGGPIDNFIQSALEAVGASGITGIVEPKTKNYWMYLNGSIYVLSRHPNGKISAWSTYEPRDSAGNVFTPEKFVIYLGRVYVRAIAGQFYTYGGTNNTTYDASSQVTFQTPYLDDKRPGTMKQMGALSCVKEGKWTISLSVDPQSNNFVDFLIAHGSAATPNVLTDSTYDIGNVESPIRGTHFALKGVSASTSTTLPVIFSSFLLYYNPAELTG